MAPLEDSWHLHDPDERVHEVWHDDEHDGRVDAAWHGHDHHQQPPPPPAPPLSLDGEGDGAPSRRPSPGVIAGVACMLIGLAMVAISLAEPAPEARTLDQVAAASTTDPEILLVPDPSSGTTAPLEGGALGEGVGPEVGGRTPLRGFGEVSATITSGDGEICEVCLLSAVTADQRQRGLMEVTDPSLGGYDGMLFEFPDEVAGAFWMRNTPQPLSIAYFDEQGNLVSTADMEPCEDSADCPSYPAEAPFAFAVEVPQGMLDEIGATGAATLVLNSRACPELAEG